MDPKTRLDEMMRGYQSSTVLLTAARVGLFGALGQDTRTASDLARELKLNPRALGIVLLALTADEVLERAGGGFRIASDYAPFLLPDSPLTQASIFNHNYNCLLRWVELTEVLRTGEPAPSSQKPRSEQDLRDFICGMENISRAVSTEVSAKVDLSSCRRLLDLGGGPGTASLVFARQYPDLRCVVFDLEAPLAIAAEEIAKAELTERVTTRAGDYFQDELGDGYDVVYVSNIIHSMSEEEIALICDKAHRALDAAGMLILKDFFLDDTRTQPAFAARFSVNMLVSTAGGRSYSFSEMEEILTRAGFGAFRRIEVGVASALLIATKKAC